MFRAVLDQGKVDWMELSSFSAVSKSACCDNSKPRLAGCWASAEVPLDWTTKDQRGKALPSRSRAPAAYLPPGFVGAPGGGVRRSCCSICIRCWYICCNCWLMVCGFNVAGGDIGAVLIKLG